MDKLNGRVTVIEFTLWGAAFVFTVLGFALWTM
jgi:hypothetical protein